MSNVLFLRHQSLLLNSSVKLMKKFVAILFYQVFDNEKKIKLILVLSINYYY